MNCYITIHTMFRNITRNYIKYMDEKPMNADDYKSSIDYVKSSIRQYKFCTIAVINTYFTS